MRARTPIKFCIPSLLFLLDLYIQRPSAIGLKPIPVFLELRHPKKATNGGSSCSQFLALPGNSCGNPASPSPNPSARFHLGGGGGGGGGSSPNPSLFKEDLGHLHLLGRISLSSYTLFKTEDLRTGVKRLFKVRSLKCPIQSQKNVKLTNSAFLDVLDLSRVTGGDRAVQ